MFKTQQDHARAEALALVRRFAAELPTQVVSVGYFKRVMVGRWFRREREVWHEHESLSAAVVGVRGAAGSRPWFAVTDDAVLVCEGEPAHAHRLWEVWFQRDGFADAGPIRMVRHSRPAFSVGERVLDPVTEDLESALSTEL